MTTTVTLTVHACPPGQVRAILDVIDRWELTDNGHPKPDRITLGEGYQCFQAAGGSAVEIREELLTTAPDATWTLREYATSEFLGAVFRYVPSLGTWRANADPAGDPVYSDHDLIDKVRRADATAAAVDRLIGTAWHSAIGVLTGVADGVEVTEPRRYPVTWDRRTGLLHVEGAAANGEDLELLRIPAQPNEFDEFDRRPADEVIRRAGFVLAAPWNSADRRARIQETEVYRHEEAAGA